MAVFKNKTIRGERIILDDNRYEKCTLIDCQIVYRGGYLHLDFETKNCTWAFEGAARNTIIMLQSLGLMPKDMSLLAALPTEPKPPEKGN